MISHSKQVFTFYRYSFWQFFGRVLVKFTWWSLTKKFNSQSIGVMLRSFFWTALPARGLSIRPLLFGQVELDLQAPVSSPLGTLTQLLGVQTQNLSLNLTTTLVNWPIFLKAKPLEVKIVPAENSAMENLVKISEAIFQ